MRVLMCFILLGVVVITAATRAHVEQVPQSLYDVDIQSHGNVGDREARQFGYGGYHGGHPSFGGYHGGYRGHGGYGGNNGYGGHNGYGVLGGYRGYRGGSGGYPAGYGGFGGYHGGFYG